MYSTVSHPANCELSHTYTHLETHLTPLLLHLYPIQHQTLIALLWKFFSALPFFITSIVNILVQDTIINQSDYFNSFALLSLLFPYNIQSLSQMFNKLYHLSVKPSNSTQAKSTTLWYLNIFSILNLKGWTASTWDDYKASGILGKENFLDSKISIPWRGLRCKVSKE